VTASRHPQCRAELPHRKRDSRRSSDCYGIGRASSAESTAAGATLFRKLHIQNSIQSTSLKSGSPQCLRLRSHARRRAFCSILLIFFTFFKMFLNWPSSPGRTGKCCGQSPNPPDKVNTLPSRRLNAKASRTAKPMNFPGLSLAFGELESAGTLFSCSWVDGSAPADWNTWN